jgi:salicylate 5-hydroxylase small subunit
MSTAALPEGLSAREDGALQSLLLHHAIDRFNAAYAAALDDQRFEDWPEFFLDDGHYTVQARENHARGLPLALMALESKGMLRDRVYGITQTIYHAPYYMRHVVSPARVTGEEGGRILAEANYAVFRAKPGDVGEVYNVGRYLDEFVRTDSGALLLARRLCVYDSEMVLNSLIYPI